METIAAEEPPQLVKVRLVPAQTVEERKRNIVANVVLEDRASIVPYIDDTIGATKAQKLGATQSGKGVTKRLRFYSVAPRTYHTKCPLCQQYGDAAVMRAAGLKDASCCLSTLSCFFPIFWLCCICTWCGCNREWTTKGIYCSKCGGKLGLQRRPK